MSNLLFIYSKNQWRSPTAQLLFKAHPIHVARSAGTSSKARIKVNDKRIAWAHVILVMEHKHKQLLKNKFPRALNGKQIVVLDIEDNYHFNDPQLIELLKTCLSAYL